MITNNNIIHNFQGLFSPILNTGSTLKKKEILPQFDQFCSDLSVFRDFRKRDLESLVDEFISLAHDLNCFMNLTSCLSLSRFYSHVNLAAQILRKLYIHPLNQSISRDFWRGNFKMAKHVLYQMTKIVSQNERHYSGQEVKHEKRGTSISSARTGKQGSSISTLKSLEGPKELPKLSLPPSVYLSLANGDSGRHPTADGYLEQAERAPPTEYDEGVIPNQGKISSTESLLDILDELEGELTSVKVLTSGKQRNFSRRALRVIERIFELSREGLALMESSTEDEREVTPDSEDSLHFRPTSDFLDGGPVSTGGQPGAPDLQPDAKSDPQGMYFKSGVSDLYGCKPSKAIRGNPAAKSFSNTQDSGSQKADVLDYSPPKRGGEGFFI
jgi:hypothetical protein